MGAVGGMLGLSGGAAGTGFGVSPGTNANQINQAYSQNQAALANQNDLLNALKGQGGLQKQTDVYGQLQGVVSGQGPNPAQAMLNQATGANVANQAALMGGQRGAANNVGLMARQAAQQGAGIQQQAAGQGASMQAQQSLGALGQAGNMAGTMASNQIGQTNANAQAAQNEQSILQGANNASNQIQGNLAQQGMAGQQKMIGGLMNGAGGMMGLSQGGEVSGYADGGSAFGPQSMFGQFISQPQPTVAAASPIVAPESMKFGGDKKPGPDTQSATNTFNNDLVDKQISHPELQNVAPDRIKGAGGGQVPVMLSPGEKKLLPNEAKMVAGGKVSVNQVGKKIPGKAKVAGDDYKNDTYKDKVPAGSVIIKRSIMNSKDPVRGAADFVRAVMAKKGKRA